MTGPSYVLEFKQIRLLDNRCYKKLDTQRSNQVSAEQHL